jgi:hypothetical protein
MADNKQIIIEAFNKLFTNNCNNYIFIYTPPKVGSTTLVTSLRVSLGKTYNIIHIHDDVMLNVLTGLNVRVNEIIEYIASIGKNIFVIDVYRPAIERKMSEYFEKLSPYHFNNTEENIRNYNIKRIINRFNKIHPYLALEEHYFDKYNIDTPLPFDFDKKYTVQLFNGVKYVKLRLMDSHQWESILSQILQTKIVIINDYQTKDKGIGDLYNRFKQEYKLPQNYYEDFKNDKYFNFYYSEEERNAYLNCWKNKLDNASIPYTKKEYHFYMNICLENQFYNDIQFEHYIDNGCFCNGCSQKRRDAYFKALNGEQITEKIIHNEVVIEKIQEKNKKIIQTINVVNSVNRAVEALNKKKRKSAKGGGRSFLLDI